MNNSMRSAAYKWALTFTAASAGCLFVYLATQRYGSGVSTDSVNYLAAADHLARLDGYLDHTDNPLII